MVNYFDKIKYLYPNIQRVVYWQTQKDGTPWNDLYDGIFWENTEIPKPSKEELDSLNENVVIAELLRREEENKKPDPVDINKTIKELQTQIIDFQNFLISQKNETAEPIKGIQQSMTDISAGFFAVKGFMMMLPDIKKLLEEINAKLPASNE